MDQQAGAVNQNILGFKYTPAQKNIVLTPCGGSRQIAFLRLSDSKWRWYQSIREPYHDSNKLYAMCRGVGSNEWITDRDLEDLGVESEWLLQNCPLLERNLSVKDFIGSGWINDLAHMGGDTFVMLVAGRISESKRWSLIKMDAVPVEEKLMDPSAYPSTPHFDVLLPIIQPKRVVSADGVFFVG